MPRKANTASGTDSRQTQGDSMKCEDCEQAEATVQRISKDDGLPLNVCVDCDPGAGCRPVITEGRYSNGRPMFGALCRICGWTAPATSETRQTAKAMADQHVKDGQ